MRDAAPATAALAARAGTLTAPERRYRTAWTGVGASRHRGAAERHGFAADAVGASQLVVSFARGREQARATGRWTMPKSVV